MTREIKQKLEQAAKAYFNGDGSDELSPFKAGAQTILDNPGEWGLMVADEAKQVMELDAFNVEMLQSQLTKYREALERIVNTSSVDAIAFPLQTVSEFYNIAKEALKKEVNND